MSIDPSALAESVSASFQKLYGAAGTLNSVSDELGKFITSIDESLRKLNIGLTVWVRVSGWDNRDVGDTEFWFEEVGYTKIRSKWGLCLRRVDGDYQYPDRESEEIWPFNDAPRAQRLEALDKIADLLQKLSDEATRMTAQVQARLADVKVIADSLTQNPAQHPSVRAKPNFDLSHIRKAVCRALEENGHHTAAALLDSGSWALKEDRIQVEVSIKKTMLGLTMNVEAENIVKNALRTLGSSHTFVALATATEKGSAK